MFCCFVLKFACVFGDGRHFLFGIVAHVVAVTGVLFTPVVCAVLLLFLLLSLDVVVVVVTVAVVA